MFHKPLYNKALVAVLAVVAGACSKAPQPQEEVNTQSALELVPPDQTYEFNDRPIEAPPTSEPAAPPPVVARSTPPAPPVAPPPAPAPEPQVPVETEVRTDAAQPGPENTAPANPAPSTITAPAGTRLSVGLTSWVSSRVNRTGDAVSGRVSEDVKDADGNVIIPAGSVIMGRISDLREPDNKGQGGRIELTFTSIVVNGESHPIDAVTQELPVQTRSLGREGPGTAQRAGTGAVVGAILGGLFGGGKGAAIGAGSGAAVGALSGGSGEKFEITLASSSVGCVLNGPFSRGAIFSQR